MYDAIIIGGGAAGFFGAIHLAELKPGAKILILEKTSKLLAKVRISGGGRCNVTHACFDNKILAGFYPRGNKELLGPFFRFSTNNTLEWFENRGVEIVAEEDGRMFPTSDDSQTIIDCLLEEVEKHGIEISIQTQVEEIHPTEGGFILHLDHEEKVSCKTLLMATGGHTKAEHFKYLEKLHHSIEEPVPSLFTFNLPKHPICKLMGLSVLNAEVSLPEHGLSFKGPVLVTHWGLSGPAVLKLSAFAARLLHDCDYEYTVRVNWLPDFSEEEIVQTLKEMKSGNAFCAKKIFEGIPQRMWEAMLDGAGINPVGRWADCTNKNIQALANILHASEFEAEGKTTFKEEFVTCGGIKRKEIDFRTMESKLHTGLFFAGEVIDIDGITGGFNFQAAWTTSYVAAEGMAEKL